MTATAFPSPVSILSAICVPSGDHEGIHTYVPGAVSRWTSVPSAFIVQTLSPPTASLVPSRDHSMPEIEPETAAISRRCEPSGSITHTVDAS